MGLVADTSQARSRASVVLPYATVFGGCKGGGICPTGPPGQETIIPSLHVDEDNPNFG